MKMSCNGCRILRKRCSGTCVLGPSIKWIDGADAQAHATVFAAKFFGRSTLLSLLSSAALRHRPAVFRSLLYEACGRSINPVSGATGLLWTGRWHLCHTALETVLAGGTIHPLSELGRSGGADGKEHLMQCQNKRRRSEYLDAEDEKPPAGDGGLYLNLCFTPKRKLRAPTSSAEHSSLTTCSAGSAVGDEIAGEQPTLLNLFV